MIKMVKSAPPHRAHLIPQQVRDAHALLTHARRNNDFIVYADEVVFSKHTNFQRDWASKFNNTIVP